MKSAGSTAYGITGIADVATASDIVRMQNIKPIDLTGIIVLCNSSIGLFSKKSPAAFSVQKIFLRESNTVFNDLILDLNHGSEVVFCIFLYRDIHSKTNPFPKNLT